ncbi:hypothetical protein D6764_04195 [Candidatus Woesearchaeota archaeon]|nr:MAG: hypothetical protein D6764_04195 [Candidatus Woesearchaeota archaeon]
MKKNWFALGLVLLLSSALAVLLRLSYLHPWHPDHYTWGSFTKILLSQGYATWVLHPLSLFGYYPLSIPSGYEFFMSIFTLLTGMTFSQAVFVFSIISSFIAAYFFFLMMRYWTSFDTSLFASFIYLTSVFFVKVTSNNASTRITNIMLYPLFIIFLFRIRENLLEKKPGLWKNILMAAFLFILMSIIHRLSQLSIIFVIAFFLSLAVEKHRELWQWYKTTWLYMKRKPHYDRSQWYLAIDTSFVVFSLLLLRFIKLKILSVVSILLLAAYYYWFDIRKANLKRTTDSLFRDILYLAGISFASKALDLSLRGRLLVHLKNILEKHSWILLLFLILLIAAAFAVLSISRRKHHLIRNLREKSVAVYETITGNSHYSIAVGLFLVFILFSLKTISGSGFYRTGFEHYTHSFLLSGDSFFVILFNFILNLTNNVTPLIWFAPFAFVHIAFKPAKSFYDYFWLVTAIGFSQFILDWEYIRLYMIPVYSVFSSLGLVLAFRVAVRRSRKIAFALLSGFLLLHILFAVVFVQRDFYLSSVGIEEPTPYVPEEYLVAAGNFMSDDSQYSIHTSSSIQLDRAAAFYSGKPNAVGAQIIYIRPDLQVERRNLTQVWRDLKSGRKVRELYYLNDWLFPGTYYHGRHIASLNGRTISDPIAWRIIDSYSIKYLIDSPVYPAKTRFFESVQPLKNKVYSSGMIDIYDLNGGRSV